MSGKKREGRGKEKKALRKEANERENARRNIILTAASIDDHLAYFEPFRRFNRNGIDVSIRSCSSKQMSKAERGWAFDLLKLNMQTLYERGTGWSDAAKRRALESDDARFLLVREARPAQNRSGAKGCCDRASPCSASAEAEAGSATAQPPEHTDTDSAPGTVPPGCSEAGVCAANGSPEVSGGGGAAAAAGTGTGTEPGTDDLVGFVHFQFEAERELAVLYVYEVQLAPRVRRRGLGKFLMQLIELIARRCGMTHTFLTVFKENTAAMELYGRVLKYQLDESSPEQEDDSYSHVIMCKVVGHVHNHRNCCG